MSSVDLDKLEFATLSPEKFPKQTNPQTGPPPLWDKPTEGPSVIDNDVKPLKSTGAFDKKFGQYSTELTPRLGTEYTKEVRLEEVIDNDELLKDLAINISRRGVVFFRNQDSLSVKQQKELVVKLGALTGRPATSGLHIHPVTPAGGVIGDDGLIDPEVSFIYSELSKGNQLRKVQEQLAASGWHSDITFEPVPADYSSLRILDLPETGGDTLWGNGYALYEKFSPSFRQYLDTLTGLYAQPSFNVFGKEKNFPLYTQERGAPENVGEELKAIHPIVRTNPVTGWKAVFALGGHFDKVNDVTPIESALIKKYISNTLYESHDIHVRFKWNKYDIAIWDNRSTYHTATFDYLADQLDEKRAGIRTVGIGERPFLNTKSLTQSEGLKAESEVEGEGEDKAKKEEKKEEEKETN